MRKAIVSTSTKFSNIYGLRIPERESSRLAFDIGTVEVTYSLLEMREEKYK